MPFGIEVKPANTRKFKRLSVSMLNAAAMIQDASAYVLQYAQDNKLCYDSIDWRVINRETDSIVAKRDH